MLFKQRINEECTKLKITQISVEDTEHHDELILEATREVLMSE